MLLGLNQMLLQIDAAGAAGVARVAVVLSICRHKKKYKNIQGYFSAPFYFL
jgi:hypothetical protein